MLGKIKSKIEYFKVKMMDNNQYCDYLRTKGVTIGTGCNITKKAIFGSEPWLIRLGDNVRITRNVEFITHDGGLWTLRKMGLLDEKSVKYGPITIGDNCNISWNVIILPGVHIGANSVVAAGAVVTKDVPPGTIVGGVPAKKIETIYEYYDKVIDNVVPTFSMTNGEKKRYLEEHCPDMFR